ncbi:hypothetical protein NDU88_009113 [Pleurodeles waltl]|uniref:Uncharacterized protein n=1 Tax=Pleurodeles waltl TaxID=8319 RepID=A0AAV7PV04_PLEWA|nr:hypothetical protein NDU88_009113 [Pleurodeles waltl]
MEARPSSNPWCPCALAKQDQATGTVLGCPEEEKLLLDPLMGAKLREDQSVPGEAGASWQALLSTIDAMSAAIYYQADKHSFKGYLMRRAQAHSYTMQVLCQCASTEGNSPKITEILNNTFTEVRAQAPRSQVELCRREGSVLDNHLEKTGTDIENRNPHAICSFQQEQNQGSSGCCKNSSSQPEIPSNEEPVRKATNTPAVNEVSLTKRGKKRQRKARNKVKVAQQNSIWKSFAKANARRAMTQRGKSRETWRTAVLTPRSITPCKRTTRTMQHKLYLHAEVTHLTETSYLRISDHRPVGHNSSQIPAQGSRRGNDGWEAFFHRENTQSSTAIEHRQTSQKFPQSNTTSNTGKKHYTRNDTNLKLPTLISLPGGQSSLQTEALSDHKFLFIPQYNSKGAFAILNRGTIIKLIKEIRPLVHITTTNLKTVKFVAHPNHRDKEATGTSWAFPAIIDQILAYWDTFIS